MWSAYSGCWIWWHHVTCFTFRLYKYTWAKALCCHHIMWQAPAGVPSGWGAPAWPIQQAHFANIPHEQGQRIYSTYNKYMWLHGNFSIIGSFECGQCAGHCCKYEDILHLLLYLAASAFLIFMPTTSKHVKQLNDSWVVITLKSKCSNHICLVMIVGCVLVWFII